MKRILLSILFFFQLLLSVAQVGIGTTTPDPSSQLDITASDKGILIPKVSLVDVTDTMLDGVNTAATGLLIYNTNASTTGGSGVGYYYFNGTTWERLVTSATSSGDDHDFYEVGTSSPPDDITDDIFTQGNVAIGKSTADFRLDIEETTGNRALNININGTANNSFTAAYLQNSNTGTAPHFGLFSVLSGAGTGIQQGITSEITNSGDGLHYGFRNFLNGAGSGIHYGSYTQIQGAGTGDQYSFYSDNNNGGDGDHYGIYQVLRGTGSGIHYGTYSHFALAGTGPHTGTYNYIGSSGGGVHTGNQNVLSGGGDGGQYGTRNTISNGGIDLHYGIYNLLSGGGSGTHQGAENVLIGGGTGVQVGTRNTIANDGNNIHYGTYNDLQGTGSGSHLGSYSRLRSNGIGSQTGYYSSITNSGTGWHIGIRNNLNGSSATGNTDGVYNYITRGGSGSIYGIRNDISNVTSTGVKYGLSNTISGSGSIKYGVVNSVYGTATSTQGGIYNGINTASDVSQYGVQNHIVAESGNNSLTFGVSNYVGGLGDGVHYGSYNLLGGTGSGEKYGLFALIENTAGGTHYGVFSNVSKAGSYAGYFLGTVSVGTNTANNYLLPASRGTVNQVMQTDGAGNLSWVNDPSPSYWTRTGGVLNLATATDDITFTSDQTSITFPASLGTPATMINIFSGGTSNANKMVIAHSPTYPDFGLEYDDSNDAFSFLGAGNEKVKIGLTGNFPLVVDATTLVVNGSMNRVGIGTAAPGYALDVVGDINTSGDIRQNGVIYTHPDYVFESYFEGFSDYNPNYSLQSLSEIEIFLKENKHLPGVQNRVEIEKEGWIVTEAVRDNLEKIEELYLYTIEANKKINTLSSENETLKLQLQKQQEEIDEIKALINNKK